MQKVLQRTANAKIQHARKLAKVRAKNARIQRTIDYQQYSPVGGLIQKDLKDARRARREDWELGPLAPRRNVGAETETYGAVDSRRLRGPEKPKTERLKIWNFVEGDRVVIIEGRDKGKIGTIKKVHKNSEEVEVEGLNMLDVKVPEFLKSEQDNRSTLAVEAAVPLSSIRLVFPLQDEKNGVQRDVIVKQIANTTPRLMWDADSGKKRRIWRRFIPGLNVTIPWPKREAEELSKTYDIDTIRVDLEEQTWIPTLITPPMPLSVIDELRNKYSIFRDRHDPEYIQKKEAESQEALDVQQSSILMRTPLQEANQRARQERKSKGKGKLTPEMLSRLGAAMAAKRARLAKPKPAPA